MEKENINFNYNECIKSYDKFGETIYQNICNGEKTSVPWGFSGYGLGIFFILIGILIISFIVVLVRDLFEWY